MVTKSGLLSLQRIQYIVYWWMLGYLHTLLLMAVSRCPFVPCYCLLIYFLLNPANLYRNTRMHASGWRNRAWVGVGIGMWYERVGGIGSMWGWWKQNWGSMSMYWGTWEVGMGDEKVVGVSMCWGEDGEMGQVLGWGWGMCWVEDGNEEKRGGEWGWREQGMY